MCPNFKCDPQEKCKCNAYQLKLRCIQPDASDAAGIAPIMQCLTCKLVFHPRCHYPPITAQEVQSGDWTCQMCSQEVITSAAKRNEKDSAGKKRKTKVKKKGTRGGAQAKKPRPDPGTREAQDRAAAAFEAAVHAQSQEPKKGHSSGESDPFTSDTAPDGGEDGGGSAAKKQGISRDGTDDDGVSCEESSIAMTQTRLQKRVLPRREQQKKKKKMKSGDDTETDALAQALKASREDYHSSGDEESNNAYGDNSYDSGGFDDDCDGENSDIETDYG